ncbi:MAG: T9SS type A sorting domain-containing protein [Bacteroidota bacterium]|nr:T9SS type A sorting domain-containing protein [Bacteroidota bacterium]
MKKILLFLAFTLVIIQGFAQDDSHVLLNSEYYNSSSASDETFLATAPDGLNVIASTLLVEDQAYLNIKKIDILGNVNTLINLYIADFTYYSVQEIAFDADGSFVVCVKFPNAMHLIKVSSTYNILWQKSFNFPWAAVSNYFSAGIKSANMTGDYYFSVNRWDCLGIIKLDNSGNVLWSQKIVGPYTDSMNTLGLGIDKCPGFSTAVTSAGGCISTIKDDSYEGIINLDANGQLIWANSFIGSSYRWPRCINEDASGNFFIMGSVSNTNSYLHKLDAAGNVVSGKMISDTIVYEDMDFDAAGNIYLIGKPSAWSSQAIKLAKLSPVGDYLWTQSANDFTLNYTQNNRPHFSKNVGGEISFLVRKDSSYLVTKFEGDLAELCGFTGIANDVIYDDIDFLSAEVNPGIVIDVLSYTISTSSVFQKTSTEYFTSQNYCSLSSVEENNKGLNFSVYPNPSSQEVNIVTNELITGTVMVYDALGRKVVELQLHQQSEVLSVKSLSPGLYHIVITDDKSNSATQRLIIQK